MDSPSLSIDETAAMLRIHRETVRKWIAAGKLPAWQPFPGGRVLISRAEVERLLAQRPA